MRTRLLRGASPPRSAAPATATAATAADDDDDGVAPAAPPPSPWRIQLGLAACAQCAGSEEDYILTDRQTEKRGP